MSRRPVGKRPDAATFITTHLRLEPVPGLPHIRLYAAHAGSGLWRLDAGSDDAPAPYWAYRWGGGLALAHHIAAHPDTVRGKRVFDLGSGSGLVGIAAGLAGAVRVAAIDIDPRAVAATALNAEANGVSIAVTQGDILDGPPPDVDLLLAGDVFYAPELAVRVVPFLERCRAAGIAVLVGDPYRTPLPRDRLTLMAEYDVADFGARTNGAKPAGVFAFAP